MRPAGTKPMTCVGWTAAADVCTQGAGVWPPTAQAGADAGGACQLIERARVRAWRELPCRGEAQQAACRPQLAGAPRTHHTPAPHAYRRRQARRHVRQLLHTRAHTRHKLAYHSARARHQPANVTRESRANRQITACGRHSCASAGARARRMPARSRAACARMCGTTHEALAGAQSASGQRWSMMRVQHPMPTHVPKSTKGIVWHPECNHAGKSREKPCTRARKAARAHRPRTPADMTWRSHARLWPPRRRISTASSAGRWCC